MLDFQYIDVDQIKTEAQFRTRNGFDSSLGDLQTSIALNGLMQPITVRLDDDNGYVVVAGHRRFAAVQLLKWQHVPCIVSTSKAEYRIQRAQLTENLQRVDLDLLDTARAVRALADKAGTQGSGLSQLAADLGKSKTWVSRHLSLTDPKFSAKAQAHVQAGNITDLEVAHALHQIEKTKGPNKAAAAELFDAEIANGRMTRKLAIDLLAMAKTAPDSKPAPDADTSTDGKADPDETTENDDDTPQSKPIRLSPEAYAAYLEKGGIDWLMRELGL